MADGLCSQHGHVCDKVFEHAEKISRNSERLENAEEALGRIFARIEKMEEVQTDMVHKLEVAANGLRALATKIDDAVTSAKNNGITPSGSAAMEPGASSKKKFSDQLNEAWDKFTSNFALFIIYSLAGSFVWALWKTVSGDWRVTPAWLKVIVGG